MLFKKYAKYYDLLYLEKDYANESVYINDLLKQYGEGDKLLEFGCGTGKHASFLSTKGYTVHGVDVSPQMLEEAIKQYSVTDGSTPCKLSFEQGDIKFYKSNKTYDSVISLFHVMSYQKTNTALDKVFFWCKRSSE